MESETTASGKPEGQIQIVAQSHCKSGSWVVTTEDPDGDQLGLLRPELEPPPLLLLPLIYPELILGRDEYGDEYGL